jgi:dTDP-4-amino-4,6-dideoxygalactose transaminase
MPIYLHPYYQSLGYEKGLCPVSEDVYSRIITLPMFPLLKDEDINKVISTTLNILNKFKI